ncbi:hypothetical protein HF292_010025 [Acidithiobacillus ferruginosus]|uniref:Uncharacterized protein n=2 Tax=Acidithiobacillus TaxID=119977 RepID=A0ACD5IHH5_9PROT|nr:hypothetical protein [Acidithiobacillus ferrooxidans]MBU2812920.1 hypothetical protein [Acidithiobacillus ferruginosus]MBU2857555.1 hypothetical protein [Acidithiobacillus ferrooxidans]MBU2859270.1 hypothetical protein [Acidithiobacillus ferrooxidans]
MMLADPAGVLVLALSGVGFRGAALQVDLEDDKCHNRSHVSDDNPYSKVQSTTLFAAETSTQSGTIELPGFIGNMDNYLSWQ